jgi:small subunit ribosomal protein S9
MGAYFMKPFILTRTQQTAYVTAKIEGSGIASQEDALIHGIARALVKLDEAHKIVLRKAGLLTRDARMKESRKIGTGGKARRVKQSPKR